ncbi:MULTISPECIES: type II secretion system protein GspC [unclassified Photobacterium]|uniref:type II secretion system protein GspC n=1 Tax=unclassified Photobacterium TaxID=2628852 RepID=UPI000D162992|nr:MULTISPECIES: type II secretion system protein GspC [unclassified Photobacterium]PSV24783.1 type II secretion system protein GspC [Photobacterium sp. GB-56]PSV29344.1 type II secretion system protein GspC [Photobacterium sp. GB-72]PSV35214.1 type II secretion system protein GspC [Photobacterium sp. GB-27]PSV35641.1 type II secretion system protein GspC [Photobacterium sp. GB-210]PSV42301.1 type II secretion system protein GspC [Photobacterium sp. GB-36]
MQVSTWLPMIITKRPLSQRTLTRLLTWLLVVILAWISGRMVWMLLAPPATVAPWQAKSVKVATSGSDINVGNLLSMNLFGQYNAQPKPVEATVKKDAPQTRLNLKLVGVVASSDPQSAFAVITNNGKQNTYGVNEVVDGTRVTLKAVYNDRVIISNSGRDETVMLEGLKFSKSAQPATQKSTSNNATKPNVDSSKLAEIKKKILAQPQSLFSYIRLSQVKKDGEVQGYRVNPGKDRILFDSVGLKANDLAVAINGNSLTDPSVMAKLWAELSSATDFTLTVERGGQVHDIHIELQ